MRKMTSVKLARYIADNIESAEHWYGDKVATLKAENVEAMKVVNLFDSGWKRRATNAERATLEAMMVKAENLFAKK